MGKGKWNTILNLQKWSRKVEVLKFQKSLNINHKHPWTLTQLNLPKNRTLSVSPNTNLLLSNQLRKTCDNSKIKGDKTSISSISLQMRWTCWLPLWMTVILDSRVILANCKNTMKGMVKAKIVLFKKRINFFKLIQKLTCKLHLNLSLKSQKKPNLVLTLKLSKRLWLTLSNSKRSMLTQVWFKMTSYQCTTTLETFPVITSWMMLGTKELVALATQLASCKLSTPVLSSSMEKRPKIFLHNKY